MQKTILLLTLIGILFPAFSQSEKTNYKNVADTFEKQYNADQFNQIFGSFSTEMQAALPLEKTVAFLKGLKAQAGNIKKREFTGYENSTYASYKTQFEHALFAVNISVDNTSKINGLLVKPLIDNGILEIERNTTKLQLPFKNEWTIVWGGDTKEQNYHVESPAQKNAFDMVITDPKGKSYKTNGQTNEDYYAFEQELLASCDGEVVMVVDGIKDNKPGEMNPIYVPGNTVIIKTATQEYIFIAHFKQHSIQVKQGQRVKQGQLLGLCGNSGNSSEPHIHFHLQNVENMTKATGIKCYFDNMIVNGQKKTNYSPVQKDKVKPE